MSNTGWIGVDLDGTLLEDLGKSFKPWLFGKPVPKMLAQVKQWIAEGEDVRIFTARVHILDPQKKEEMVRRIQKHLTTLGLPELEVTNVKTTKLKALYDDRAFHVVKNTGKIIRPQ